MDRREFEFRFMYLLKAPIIVADPSWPIPEVLKESVIMERLLYQKEIFEERMATEWEAMIYLSNASSIAPLDSTYTDIYLKLVRKNVEKIIGKNEVPDFLQDVNPELTDYERRELEDLRRRIFARQEKEVEKMLKEEKAPENVKEEDVTQFYEGEEVAEEEMGR